MKKWMKVMALLTAAVIAASALAACGGSGSKDIFAGTWKQTDEVDGNWTFTFDGSGKCTLNNEFLNATQDGTYTIDEKAGTVTVKMELWDSEIIYNYTLSGDTLDLKSTYSSYHLIKQS